MDFFSGIMCGLMIGVILMCILQAIPDEDDEFEMDIEEKKDDNK